MVRNTSVVIVLAMLGLLTGCPPMEMPPPDDTPGMDLPDDGMTDDQPGDGPVDEMPGDEMPPVEPPPVDDEPVDDRADDPAAQFASDDLAGFVLAVDGGALGADDLRMLTVGAEVLFSVPGCRVSGAAGKRG